VAIAGDSIEAPVGKGSWLPRPSTFALMVCGAIIAWFVLVPVSALIYTAFAEDTPYGPGGFTLENFVSAYSSPHLYRLFWNSLVFAGGTAFLTFLLGLGVAWVVERTDAPGKEIWHALALMSFAIPGLLTTMAWMLTLSPNIGWLNALIKATLGPAWVVNIYSMGGMIWALSSHYFPLAYLLLAPAMRSLDIRMEEAAAMAGARSVSTLFRVTLPLMRPAILSTVLLLFVRGMESYEVPRLVGNPARIEVFTTDIQRAISGSTVQFGLASALSLTLLVICLVAVWLYSRATRNAESFATITGKGYKPVPMKLGGWRWPVAGLIALMYVATLGLPLLTLVWQSFYQHVAIPFMPATDAASLHNYSFILTYPIFLHAVRTSILLAALAASIVVAVTFVSAWVAHRGGNRFGWMLDALASSAIAVPGVIVGASVLFAYLMMPWIPIYNTIWILLVAYVTIYLPYGMRFAASGMAQIHKELEEAAYVAGASPGQTFVRVLLPLLAPVIVSAWLYVFVLAVRELGSSVFLIGPGTHVLGTIALTMWEEGGSYGAISALGVLQILPLLVIVALLRWVEKRAVSRYNNAADDDSGEGDDSPGIDAAALAGTIIASPAKGSMA
jgi:iron(III) transport system permease protein